MIAIDEDLARAILTAFFGGQTLFDGWPDRNTAAVARSILRPFGFGCKHAPDGFMRTDLAVSRPVTDSARDMARTWAARLGLWIEIPSRAAAEAENAVAGS